ncbi:hypothetical protein HJD18_15445 [Thermoleophilia bacterium SCSIO 60948]|nr:hypothetical protein HJD18_15445 [Thermoleophilia bacterium SCSIO 60948]
MSRDGAAGVGPDGRWGSDSEYATLHDILLGPPENYRWRATSMISKATLESGRTFDGELALAQHRELMAAYDQAGVRTHFLEGDPVLPYQVFSRDSSVMTPWGGYVTAPKQQWRRGEYSAVLDFYAANDIPLWRRATAGAIEGGDVVVIEPGKILIGNGEERTEVQAANQLADWFRAEGWEARVEPIPGHFIHIDVLVSVLAPRVAAVCVDAAPTGLVRWLRDADYEILEVSVADAFGLGVNAISLGDERVISASGSAALNEKLRALGLEVFDPDLSMFTLGGGGAHCLGQPLRRTYLSA